MKVFSKLPLFILTILIVGAAGVNVLMCGDEGFNSEIGTNANAEVDVNVVYPDLIVTPIGRTTIDFGVVQPPTQAQCSPGNSYRHDFESTQYVSFLISGARGATFHFAAPSRPAQEGVKLARRSIEGKEVTQSDEEWVRIPLWDYSIGQQILRTLEPNAPFPGPGMYQIRIGYRAVDLELQCPKGERTFTIELECWY